MKRLEAETLILEHLKGIKAVLEQYCPDSTYLGMGIVNGNFHANNRYWAEDKHHPIDIFFDEENNCIRINGKLNFG